MGLRYLIEARETIRQSAISLTMNIASAADIGKRRAYADSSPIWLCESHGDSCAKTLS